MTSRHETELNLESEPAPYRKLPAGAEAAYDRLIGYGFARRFVKGKIVADIGWEEVGYGSRLLAETAGSVTGLGGLPEAVDLASSVYPAPNVSYRRANLPELPLSAGHFDVVVAFGLVENLERPEALVREAKRVLKEDGVFVISTLDRQANASGPNRESTDGRREMYVPEFKEMLERHFGHVRIYRQGAVAGGFVFPARGEEAIAASVEVARFTLADPHFGAGPPITRSVIAVCSDVAEAVEREEQPYLLLDRDRRVFDEYEERVEDVELLRGEIRQMQETEVQAFVDALKIRVSLIQELPRYLPHMQSLLRDYIAHRRNIIRGNIYIIRRKGAKGLARGALRRSVALYRRLKTRDAG
jgi:SAM-dependent methyltransferase